MAVTIKRLPSHFYPDPRRVIARFYMPVREDRAQSIIKNIMDLSENEANHILNQVLRNFSARHRNISKLFEKSYNKIKEIVGKVNEKKYAYNDYNSFRLFKGTALPAE